MKNNTSLMWFYLLCAMAGIVVPWYFNLQYMMSDEPPFTVAIFLQHGYATALSSSITSDFLIVVIAAYAWMVSEYRKLKMKRFWMYFISSFLIAFAFTFPFFLYMRERKLQEIEVN